MQMLAFFILMIAVFVGGGFGFWFGSWMYHLCPMKGNLIYILALKVVAPIMGAAAAVSLVMPVVAFLAGIGRKH